MIKLFETWNDNKIDNSMFISGRAKFNPKIVGNRIKYKTGKSYPYYTAVITQVGSKFYCKIYKHKAGGKIRVSKKSKKTVKTAHDYVRNYLSDRVDDIPKKKKKKKKIRKEPNFFSMESKPISKTIIRRYI